MKSQSRMVPSSDGRTMLLLYIAVKFIDTFVVHAILLLSIVMHICGMHMRIKDLDIVPTTSCAVFKIDHPLFHQVFILQGIDTPLRRLSS
jgi:hypothetical protein